MDLLDETQKGIYDLIRNSVDVERSDIVVRINVDQAMILLGQLIEDSRYHAGVTQMLEEMERVHMKGDPDEVIELMKGMRYYGAKIQVYKMVDVL